MDVYKIPVIGGEKVIEPDHVEYKIYYGGTVIRIWNFQGEVMFSTHRKIDARNSKWGSSDTFSSLFENNQSTYKISEIPVNGNVVHIFLINDPSLLIDTRSKLQHSRVVYLETFNLDNMDLPTRLTETSRMRLIIDDANLESDNPIFFPEIIDRETANSWLKFGSLYPRDDKNFIWEGGEKVLVAYEGEVFTFMSDSAQWRHDIMDGKSNIKQLYASLIENKKKNIYPYGFPIEVLESINRELQETGYISLAGYQETGKTNNKYLIAITNLFFAAPINRLDEVIDAYKSFENDLVNTINFLILHGRELLNLSKEKKLETFPSLHNKKTIVTQLQRNIQNLMEGDSRPFSDEVYRHSNYWPTTLQNLYEEYYKDFTAANKANKRQFVINAQILVFVVGLYGDVLYSFITLPERYQKTVAAWERSSASKTAAI